MDAGCTEPARHCSGPGARAALALLALGACLLGAQPAHAHPLGNFSINHQTRIEISADRIDLLYILDQAEIPTFQERKRPRADVLRDKLGEVREGLWVVADGKRRELAPRSRPRLTYPAGQAGLRLTRLEVPLRVKVARPKVVEVRDLTFRDRAGWVDLVSVPGHGTRVATTVSPRDPTAGLRTYRGITLEGVPDQVVGRFFVGPGKGSLLDTATGEVFGSGEGPLLDPDRAATGEAGGGERVDRPSDDGFAGVFERASYGEGMFLVLLLAAFGWGAVHALSPGHGKAMVAAYLIGTKGAARHAVALGGIVTVTHTIGVFALGLVTLLLSQYILPEDLYPWLNLAAGLLIVGVGLTVMRSRIGWARARAAMTPDAQGHAHHHHGHDHHLPDTNWRGVTGMGVSAGLIPCPSALVVLLAAITQREIALGLLLIVVFSLGLAMTLTALGLAVVYAKRLTAGVVSRFALTSRLAAVLPAASTALILCLGIVLTAKAIPDVI